MKKLWLVGKKTLGVTCVFFGIALSSAVNAGVINQDVGLYGNWLGSDLGQSFTAEDAKINSIGVSISDWNRHLGAPFSLDISLYAGDGISGVAISNKNIVFADGFGGVDSSYGAWFDFDFKDVTLTAGNIYTFSIHSPNQRGGIFYNYSEVIDSYAGGTMHNVFGKLPYGDLMFRVIPTDISEPISLALFGLGLGGIGWARRKAAY
jgi:hypothetical protein